METIIWMSVVGVYFALALCVGVLMLRRRFKGQEQVRERNRAPLKIFLFILIGSDCRDFYVRGSTGDHVSLARR